MDPKLKEALDALRAEVGKNAEAVARVAALETANATGAADLKKVQIEIESIRAANAASEKAFKDAIQENRRVALDKDPIKTKRDAIVMMGMMTRQIMVRAKNIPVPERFKDEAQRVADYMAQRATLSELTTGGTVFVPTILEGEIIDTLEELSKLLGEVDFKTGVPSKITIPTLTTRPTLQPKRASTDTALSQTDPAFSYMSVDSDEGSIFFPVDNNLLELSPFSLGALMLPLARDAFLEGLCTWLLKADGTATYNSLTGILKEATYVETMAKNAFGDLTAMEVRGLKTAVLQKGRSAGKFLMSDYALSLCENMDRLGKIAVVTYGNDGLPRIFGSPVLVDAGMPGLADSAASTGFIAYGDLKAMLVCICGNGIKLVADPSYRFGYNQTSFLAIAHVYLARKPVNSMRLLKTSA